MLIGLRWRTPIASAYRKLPGEAGGAPPLVVASALHAGHGAPHLVRVAVRDGYEVLSGTAPGGTDADETLDALRGTALGELPPDAWDVVRPQVTGLLESGGTD